MNDGKVQINRTLVGIIALVCLGAYVGLWFASGSNPDQNYQMWSGAFGRVGLLMGALWLSLPGKGREAAWANVTPATFVGLILAVIAVVRFPKIIIPVLVVVGLIGLVLRPRAKYRPPRH